MGRFSLDYISVKLTENFTFGDWWQFSQSPIFIPETGEVIGVNIPQNAWRIARSGKNTTVSTWGNYTPKLAELAIVENLDITRVDIAYDTENISEERISGTLRETANRVKGYYLAKQREISQSYTQGQSRDGATNETYLFGGRKSPYQLRLYSKSANEARAGFNRFEFQLRGKLAKTIWAILKERFASPKRVEETFASLEAKILEAGIFGINYGSDKLHDIDRSELKQPSKREQWIRTQVLQACIKEFWETGVNLPEILLKDFNQHFENVGLANQLTSLEQAKLALRAEHEALKLNIED